MLVSIGTGDQGLMEGAIHLLQQGERLVFVGLIKQQISLFRSDLHRPEARFWRAGIATPAEHQSPCWNDGRAGRLMWNGLANGSWPDPATMGERFPACC